MYMYVNESCCRESQIWNIESQIWSMTRLMYMHVNESCCRESDMVCNMAHSHLWHDSCICETWLIHMCENMRTFSLAQYGILHIQYANRWIWMQKYAYCRGYEWVMSHVYMSRVILMNESCHTYTWVMSYLWSSDVTYEMGMLQICEIECENAHIVVHMNDCQCATMNVYMTWLIHMYDTIHVHVGHDPFTCATICAHSLWMIANMQLWRYMCVTSHLYGRQYEHICILYMQNPSWILYVHRGNVFSQLNPPQNSPVHSKLCIIILFLLCACDDFVFFSNLQFELCFIMDINRREGNKLQARDERRV